MAIIPLGNGRGVNWEPTTDLICTKCREPFDPVPALLSVYLVHDDTSPNIHEIRILDYWYLHNQCREIEKYLKDMGANIRWRHHDMPYVLGFSIERDGYRRVLKNRENRKEWFQPGIYQQLLIQWRPAFGGLDKDVTETIDITSIDLAMEQGSPRKVLHLPSQDKALEEKPGWNALRFEILKRDNYRCRICGVASGDGPHVRLNVDHKTARAHGGTDHPDNLWVLCWECNIGKGTKAL